MATDGHFMRLVIEVDGEVQFDRAMVVAEDRMGRLMKEAGEDVLLVAAQETQRRFKTKGKRGGKPWPPLTPAYARQKRAMHRRNPTKYPARGLLRLTDDLYRSLTVVSHGGFGGGGESIQEIHDDHVIYGTAVEYAGFQKRWGREPIRFGRAAAGRFQAVMTEHALGVVRDGVEGVPTRGLFRRRS